MPEMICDGHCPLFGQGECELALFPGHRAPGRCPRRLSKKNTGELNNPFLRLP